MIRLRNNICWCSPGSFRVLFISVTFFGLELLKHPKKRFTDVKGVDEVLNEFEQVVDILRHPEKFRRMGAKTPRGILLNGPPGTGKTLIAKAIAGEGLKVC